ncbi:MAG: DegV family protein [Anaerolineae bacterium]|nr:DegV family protein [Anaerolineae bacterium]
MTSRIALVLDSTSDIPAEIAAQHQIAVAPLHIIWGKDVLRDGIDIIPAEFYTRLANDPELPTTSQPTPAEFARLYKQVIEDTGAESILTLTISADLSGTYTSAVQAKNMVDFPVSVVDMRSVSLGITLPALMVKDALEKGASLEEATTLAGELAARTDLYFTLNTLEYLHKGGRIGGAQRLIGSAFNIKPLLTLVNGKVEPKESIRTRKRALNRLIDLLAERIDESQPFSIGILHGEAPDEAAWLEAEIQQRWQPERLFKTQVGAVIGVHTGPGAVGFAVTQ